MFSMKKDKDVTHSPILLFYMNAEMIVKIFRRTYEKLI